MFSLNPVFHKKSDEQLPFLNKVLKILAVLQYQILQVWQSLTIHLTYNVKARDPVGSKNGQIKFLLF